MGDADELRDLTRALRTRPTPDQIYTQLQADRAESGQAAGQCSECGAFRSDGLPPILHQPGCSRPDGERRG
jgi:hypothetical protein